MVPMARILVVGVVFIAAPCAFAELKPTRQPISANAAAETNFMLSPLCVSLRRPGEPVGRASPARQPDSNDNRLFLDGKGPSTWLGFLGACRGISDGLTLLPLRDSLLVDPVALSEGSQALLTILYCSTDCLRRGGA